MTYLTQLEDNEKRRMDHLVHRLERKDQVFDGYLDKQFRMMAQNEGIRRGQSAKGPQTTIASNGKVNLNKLN